MNKNRLNLRVSITNKDEIPSPVMSRMSQMKLNSPTNGNPFSSQPNFNYKSSSSSSFLLFSPNKENGKELSDNVPSTPIAVQSFSEEEDSPSPTSDNPSLGRRRLTQSLTLKRRLFDNLTNIQAPIEELTEPIPMENNCAESPRTCKRISLCFKTDPDITSDDSNICSPQSDADEDMEKDSFETQNTPNQPRRQLSHSASSPTMGDLKTIHFNPHPAIPRKLANSSNGSNSSPLSRKKRSDSIRNYGATKFRNSSPSDGFSLRNSSDNIHPPTNDNAIRRTYSTIQPGTTDESKSLLPSTKKEGCFYVTPETVSMLLNGQILPNHPFLIVDCRFAYEYNGGHIKDAINIVDMDELEEKFLKQTLVDSKKTIIIFHCEFSSKRGPGLCSHLRKRDREIHYTTYPELHYPEIYVMEGGYKRFFNEQKDLCHPSCYVTMDDPSFKKECKDGLDHIQSFKMKKSLSMNNLSVARGWKQEFRPLPRDIFNTQSNPVTQSNPSTPTFSSGNEDFNLTIPSNLNCDDSLMGLGRE